MNQRHLFPAQVLAEPPKSRNNAGPYEGTDIETVDGDVRPFEFRLPEIVVPHHAHRGLKPCTVDRTGDLGHLAFAPAFPQLMHHQ